MAFDFPTNPPPGTPAITPDGAVRYWDGQKWDAAYSGGGSPGARDASNDLSTAQNATIARTLANRFADRYSVEDWLPQGQPDGTTDNSAQIQAALDAAAGVLGTPGPATRASASGNAQLLFPAHANPYIIGSTLCIPSNSHIIIEVGATLKLGVNPPGVNGRASMLALIDCATGVLIDLFGTLDGNGTNQAPSGGVTCGCLDVAVPVGVRAGVISHCAVRGGRTGLITNVYHWAINFSAATDVDVSDLAMTNTAQSGGSPGFTGVRNLLGTTPATVPATIASGNYVGATGIVTLTTTAPHFFVPGEEFATCNVAGVFDMTGPGAGNAQGCALIALPGTAGTTIVYQAPAGGADGAIAIVPPRTEAGSLTNWAKQITPTISGGTFAAGLHAVVTLTTTAPHNLTYGQTVTINATAGTNFAIAAGVFVLLGGSTGTTLRYVIPDGGTGGTVTAGTVGVSMKCYNSGFTNCTIDGVVDFGPVIYGGGVDCYIRGCEVSHCQSSGPAIFSDANFGRSIGCEISDCYVHDNYSAGIVVDASVNSSVVKHLNTRIFNNYVTRNKGGVGFSQCDGVDFSNNRLYANAVSPANVAGITGEVVVGNFSSRVKVTNNSIRDPVQTASAVVQIAASGSTYNNATGAVSLNTATAHNMNRMAMFRVTGTPSGLLDGIWQAQAGTSGTTLNYTVAAGLGAVSITGGQVVPTGFGIMIDHPEQCVIADNVIGDYQTAPSMLAAIGGTWGANGLSIGNYYGPRINAAGNFPADMSVYVLGVQGVSYDAVTGNVCRTTPGLPSAAITGFPPDGLTIGRNLSGGTTSPGRSEIDFLLGTGGSGQGGFDFVRISPIGASGTYNSTTAAVSLTTTRSHGIVVGNAFMLSLAQGFDSSGPPVTAGRDLAKLNGSWIATAGTAGTTLNFTLMAGPVPLTGLDIASISSARVNATTTDGGLVDATIGVAGSLLANDGLGNTRFGGALVHGAMQSPTLANGGTVTIPPNTSFVAIRNSTSIATGTVVLPAPVGSSYQAIGGELEINFQNAVGALTVLPAATTTLAGGPIAGAVAGNASLNYVLLNSTSWIRRIMA